MGLGADFRVVEAVPPLLRSLRENLPIAEALDQLCGRLLDDDGVGHPPNVIGAFLKGEAIGPGGLELQQRDRLACRVPLHPHEVDGKLPGVISGRALGYHRGLCVAFGAIFRGLHLEGFEHEIPDLGPFPKGALKIGGKRSLGVRVELVGDLV